jgi:hypothetical protein
MRRFVVDRHGVVEREWEKEKTLPPPLKFSGELATTKLRKPGATTRR